MTEFRRERFVFLLTITFLLVLLVGNTFYLIWGHQFIRAMYDGTAVWPFNRIITFQKDYSLQYYITQGDQTLVGLDMFFSIFFIGSIIIFAKYNKNTDFLILLGLIWTAFSFLAVHLTRFLFWDLTKERSFPEVYLFGLEIFIFVSFFLFLVKSKQKIFLWSFCVFSLVFLDDFLCLHEKLSRILGKRFELSSLTDRIDVIPRHIWEFIIFGSVGFIAVIFFVPAYFKSNRESRKLTRIILLLLFLGFFFAGFVDFIHDFPFLLRFYWLTSIFEDWGEMVTLSLITYFIFKSYKQFYPKSNQKISQIAS